MAVYAKRREETYYEQGARVLMAIEGRKYPDHYRVVRQIDPDVWYDWADPQTTKVGQCRQNADGTWHQDPRGERPVILAYRPAPGETIDINDEISAIGRAGVWLGEITNFKEKRRRPMPRRIIKEFARDGGFAGTVKVAQDKASGKLRYVIHVGGLNDRQAERLCRFLSKLK